MNQRWVIIVSPEELLKLPEDQRSLATAVKQADKQLLIYRDNLVAYKAALCIGTTARSGYLKADDGNTSATRLDCGKVLVLEPAAA